MKSKVHIKILLIYGMILLNGLPPSSSYITIIDSLSESKNSLLLPFMDEIPGGEGTQIQYGPTGNLHLIYYETSLYTKSLKYSVNQHDQWSVPQIIIENTRDQLTFDFSVDGDDKIHLSYGDSSGNISYFTNSRGYWEEQILISKNNQTIFSEIDAGVDYYFNLATSTEYSPQNKSLTLIYNFPARNHTIINQTTYINSTQSGESDISHLYPFNRSNFVNISQFDTTLVEISPSMVHDSNGTMHIVYEGLWNNPLFPDKPIWDIFYTSFTKNNTSFEFHSFTNETTIINSTTNETRSILTNTTTYFSNRTGWFSNPKKLSNSTTSLHCSSPLIAKGENDQLHVSWIQSTNNTGYQLKLGVLDENRTVWNSEKFPSEVSLSDNKYSMVYDSSNNGHFIFKKLEVINDLTTYSNITYFSNQSGTWKYSALIEPLHSLLNFDLDIEPINDDPFIMLSGKTTEDSYSKQYLLKFVEGSFGNDLGYVLSLNGKQISLQTKNDEFISPNNINFPAFDSSSQYIQAFSHRLISLSLTLENFKIFDQSPSLNIILENNSAIQLGDGNNFTHNLNSLASQTSEDFLWEFEFSQVGATIITVNFERDGTILYKISCIVIIKESFNLTPNLLIFAGLITVFSVGYWYLRKKI